LEQIFDNANADMHCYHIYCSQRLGWIRKWGASIEERKGELEELRKIVNKATSHYPRARELNQLREDIEKDYLKLAITH
jgi:hypothetical protein